MSRREPPASVPFRRPTLLPASAAAARRTARLLAGAGLVGALLAGCGGFGAEPPPEPDRTIRSYVALGDGFSSAPHVGDTADEDCLRSAQNYPALLAADLDIEVTDVSCTGTGTRALTRKTRPGPGAPRLAPQIDAVDADTDLVTIGAGIEDRELLDSMFRICTGVPCGNTVLIQTILNNIEMTAADLTEAVREVQSKAPSAFIVLVGYPRIPPAEGSCPGLPPMPEQLALDAANYVLDDLNRNIQSAARQTGSAYVDVAALSEGHELCSADPWVSGRKGKPGESVPFHPVAAEQQAVAEAVAEIVASR